MRGQSHRQSSGQSSTPIVLWKGNRVVHHPQQTRIFRGRHQMSKALKYLEHVLVHIYRHTQYKKCLMHVQLGKIFQAMRIWTEQNNQTWVFNGFSHVFKNHWVKSYSNRKDEAFIFQIHHSNIYWSDGSQLLWQGLSSRGQQRGQFWLKYMNKWQACCLGREQCVYLQSHH